MLSLIQMPIALFRLMLSLTRMTWAMVRATKNFIASWGGLRGSGE